MLKKKGIVVLTMACLGLAGCSDDDGGANIEGDEVGECTDGADNDGDGLFDCDDDDCAGSPDCVHEGDEAGECSDGADNDLDGLFDCDDDDCAGSPDCLCEGGCATEGELDCDGEVARRCSWGPDGCLIWVDVQDCTLTGASCIHGECATGSCSVSGAVCLDDGDCGGTNVTVIGSCIALDAGGGHFICGYDTRVDTGATVTCDAATFGQCTSIADCPAGVQSCVSHSADWCGGTAAEGVCTVSVGADPPCTDDAECTYLADDVCATCGDGIVDSPIEFCDDGNDIDTDGCTTDCQPGWRCLIDGGMDFGPCAPTVPDSCPFNCAMNYNCVCAPAP